MINVCEAGKCTGCMACRDACAHGAIVLTKNLHSLQAQMDPARCVGCGACEEACPQLHPLKAHPPLAWYQGWAKDDKIRGCGSSGGAAGALARAMIAQGGAVCSCAFDRGDFRFLVAEDEAALAAFAGSKYVHSDASGAYRAVKALLRQGRRVLFIGLPCQCAAVKRITREHESLVTAELICHGTPSQEVLECFLQEHGQSLRDAGSVQFRDKQRFAVRVDGQRLAEKQVLDRYMIAFLQGITYLDACYVCPYARRERISDLTLGDAWGSEAAETEKRRGVSLVLCQSEKGEALLRAAGLSLEASDAERAIAYNQQLRQPSELPKGRKQFFRRLESGKRFSSCVSAACPVLCVKQDVKALLKRTGIWK